MAVLSSHDLTEFPWTTMLASPGLKFSLVAPLCLRSTLPLCHCLNKWSKSNGFNGRCSRSWLDCADILL